MGHTDSKENSDLKDLIHHSRTTGFWSVSKKFLTNTSNVILLNERLAIETLTSEFAAFPSEIEMNLNKLYDKF